MTLTRSREGAASKGWKTIMKEEIGYPVEDLRKIQDSGRFSPHWFLTDSKPSYEEINGIAEKYRKRGIIVWIEKRQGYKGLIFGIFKIPEHYNLYVLYDYGSTLSIKKDGSLDDGPI